jgi:3-hydroxyisobutyrate dehydrogenase-like beta-hydroxyacid dehydrogenase
MSSVSIIGVGTMARILGARALAGGNAVEVIGRDPAKAAAQPVCSAAAGP